MDPDDLPEADPTKMDFAEASKEGSKAWKDIWGCGQGIGAVKEIAPTADLVARMEREYCAAKKQVLEPA